MRQQVMSGFTPQRKAISVNDKFGNTGIKKQQGSTVIKYDTLEFTGQTELRFFEGSAQRNFPLSNTGSDGNKLGVGNSLVVERAYLALIVEDLENNNVTFEPLDISGVYSKLNFAEFSFSIANSEVIKNVPILSWLPQFNKNANNENYNNFEFDTQIVIPPLLEFVAALRLPAIDTKIFDGFKVSLRLTIEGTGAIIAPRTTF